MDTCYQSSRHPSSTERQLSNTLSGPAKPNPTHGGSTYLYESVPQWEYEEVEQFYPGGHNAAFRASGSVRLGRRAKLNDLPRVDITNLSSRKAPDWAHPSSTHSVATNDPRSSVNKPTTAANKPDSVRNRPAPAATPRNATAGKTTSPVVADKVSSPSCASKVASVGFTSKGTSLSSAGKAPTPAFIGKGCSTFHHQNNKPSHNDQDFNPDAAPTKPAMTATGRAHANPASKRPTQAVGRAPPTAPTAASGNLGTDSKQNVARPMQLGKVHGSGSKARGPREWPPTKGSYLR